MKNPTHSISYKIWKTMVTTIAMFLLAVLLINATVISKYKEDLSYKQLEDTAAYKFSHEKVELNPSSDTDSTILITHFGINFQYNTPILHVDSFTNSVYPGKEGQNLLSSISKVITQKTKDATRGEVKVNGTTYIYYIQWLEPSIQAIVFFSPKPVKDNALIMIVFLFIGLMIISFFTSNRVAKKLAKPIQELELFAEEVAKRNWNAIVPQTDPDEIGLLANSLENMRDALKIAEERDRKFLQSTSHDLKTPVMIIKGYAQALIDGIHIESDETVAIVIKKETERLERRITQLLRLNTLGHSLEYRGERNYVRVDRILNSLVNRFKVVSPQLEWQLTLLPLEIVGDSEALLIAFENIIENQLRFAKTLIRITMLSKKETTILIENDGDLFLVEDPMILFDPYKKDTEGKFGLGLAIASQVIKSHQGDIIAYNTNTGVAFKITF